MSSPVYGTCSGGLCRHMGPGPPEWQVAFENTEKPLEYADPRSPHPAARCHLPIARSLLTLAKDAIDPGNPLAFHTDRCAVRRTGRRADVSFHPLGGGARDRGRREPPQHAQGPRTGRRRLAAVGGGAGRDASSMAVARPPVFAAAEPRRARARVVARRREGAEPGSPSCHSRWGRRSCRAVAARGRTRLPRRVALDAGPHRGDGRTRLVHQPDEFHGWNRRYRRSRGRRHLLRLRRGQLRLGPTPDRHSTDWHWPSRERRSDF